MLGVAQPLPMLLSLMRAYERKEIKLALLKRAVRGIFTSRSRRLRRNLPISAKKEILDAASGVWVGDFVLGGDGWDREEIEERTIELAGQAYDELRNF